MALLIVLGLGAYLRFHDLADLPPPLHIDEAAQGVNALELLEGKRAILEYGWTHHLNTAFIPTGIVLKLFGPTVWNLRATEAAFGLAAVLLTYLLGTSMFSWRVGLAAAALLSFNHFAIAFSRIGLVNQQSMTVGLLAFALLWVGFKRRRRLPAILGGAAAGAGLYMYFGSWIVPVVLAAFVVWALVMHRRQALMFWRLALWALLGFALAILPWLAFPIFKTEEFRQRPTEVFILSDLDRYKEGWKTDSALEVFRLQAHHTVKVFYRGGDTSNQYGHNAPLLDPTSRWLFYVGIAIAVLSLRRASYAFLLLWFGLTLVIGGILTDTPPFVPRLVGLFPAVALLAGLGLERPLAFLAWASGRWGHRLRMRVGNRLPGIIFVAPIFLAALGVVSFLSFRWHYQAYFTDYPVTPHAIYWPWIEPMSTIGAYLSSFEGDTRAYLLRTPGVWTAHRIIQFQTYGRDLDLIDVVCSSSPCDLPKPESGVPAVYIFLPEDRGQLEQLQEDLPGGITRSFTGRVNPDRTVSEMFVAYEVPLPK